MKKKLLHQKPVMFLLLAIAIALCAVPPQSEGARAAFWNCFDSYEYSRYQIDKRYDQSGSQPAPIINAWALSEPLAVGGDTYKGTIETGGIVKDAVYHTEGLSHRWDFDLNQDNGDYEASFIIEPDGTGRYYYFKGQGTSLVTQCEKTR